MWNSGAGCYDWTTCEVGQSVSWENACVDCREYCLSCEDFTQDCSECEEGFQVNSSGDCVVPSDDCTSVGDPEDPASCVEPYSSERVLPPFDADDELVDWRSWGVVNPVRDQQTCGSCWAFMSTGGAETSYAIKYGPLYKLSEQQLVSCDTVNLGCQGGWPTDAFVFWQTAGTIQRDLYPYTNDEATCYQDDIEDRLFYTTGYAYTAQNDLEGFKASIRDQPQTIAFGVADEFMYYFSGVYQGECTAAVNHGMVAIGYGSEDGVEYAIVRNSWGENWGEDGYVRVEMGEESDGGKCMMMQYPNHPTL